MSKRDYYEILGVAKDASEADLKAAFRKLAMKYHPDRNPGDQEAEKQFRELNEAYDVLKDEQKRAAYDRYGHSAFANGNGASAGAGFGGGNFSDIFEDLFGDFMGGGRRQRGNPNAPTRGSDLRYNLEISLDEAFQGKEKEVRITTSASCGECEGSGSEKGSKPTICNTCGGVGKLRAQQGFFTVERSCHTCSGSGQIIKNPCKKCGGSGRVRQDKTLKVTIPRGVDEGTRIRLSGEGEAGSKGGSAGDLYIFLSIAPHRFFKREGADLHCQVPIRMTTATLGGFIEVPTLESTTARVTIPAGTQTGQQFRLRDKGMPIVHSSARGSIFVHVMVETPVNLSKDQKELLKKFDESGGKADTSPESSRFFGKMKELWQDLKE
jgi:molecular chaperone DnaJ